MMRRGGDGLLARVVIYTFDLGVDIDSLLFSFIWALERASRNWFSFFLDYDF